MSYHSSVGYEANHVLYKHEYISDKVYDNALELIDGIKVELIDGYANSLWEYDFVHTWENPDSISEEEFTVEKDQFDNSFKGIEYK